MAQIFSPEQNEQIVLSAVNSLSSSTFPSHDDFTRAVIIRALTIQDLLREDGAAMRVLNAIRLYAHIDSVKYEETSKRYVVEFTVPDGEPEKIRTPRMDTPEGKLVEQAVQRAEGHWAIVYKNNEPAPESSKSGRMTPSHGYRVMPWINVLD